MGFNLNFSFGNNAPQTIERDLSGNFFYEVLNQNANLSKFKNDKEKLNVVLSNPAALKVFALNCDLFSLGKINTPTETDFLYSQRKKPNFKQNWTQFLWDYMFFMQLGTAYLWTPNNQLNETSPIQWLNPANIEFDSNIVDKLNSLILSKITYSDIVKGTIKYNIGNTSKIIPISEITPFYDLTNSISDNSFKGISRLDALYKVISNSENALNAKNINLEFSQKFVATAKNDSLESVNMTDVEKRNIEGVVRSSKSVHAIKKPIEIKRFVDDIARLKLDECFYNDYFMIGSMYGIPKDILESNLKGSTYENQEKATNRHVEYVLKPKGQLLTDTFEEKFNYSELFMSWEHLAFNQVFEKERQEVIKLKLDNKILADQNNINLDEL
jgi:hypothetical protein